MACTILRQLNDLEWLLDENGAERIFSNQTEAEAFLLKNGFAEDDLEWMIFLEVEQETDATR